VQYGTAAPPQHVRAVAYIDHGDLQALMRAATAVVVQGGPIGIKETRRAGRLPIVVPRHHDLGEHVDNHQQAFASQVAEVGQALVPTTEAEMRDLLDRAVTGPDAFRVDPDDDEEVAAAVRRFELIVAELRPRRGLFGRRGR
jgi:UDP-N-acetylglucosamine transferase subunit ALG13